MYMFVCQPTSDQIICPIRKGRMAEYWLFSNLGLVHKQQIQLAFMFTFVLKLVVYVHVCVVHKHKNEFCAYRELLYKGVSSLRWHREMLLGKHLPHCLLHLTEASRGLQSLPSFHI